MDGSAALENIMLAAASLGIGSCWIHATSTLFATEAGRQFQKKLGIPDDSQCIDGCALGYAQGAWPEAKPRAEDVIPVSYTHLDVYKRQLPDRGQPLVKGLGQSPAGHDGRKILTPLQASQKQQEMCRRDRSGDGLRR